MQAPGTPDVVFKEEKKLLKILRHVDMVLEVLDARLPLTSRNTRLAKMLAVKNVIILNKADLAEKEITGRWLDFFCREGRPAFPFSTKNPTALKELEKKLLQRSPRDLKFNRPLRLVVAGIPNVGKSSIINRLAGRFALKTGARPGITRGPQWIRLRAGWEMLDTPGLLYPYLRNENSKLALAVIGALERDAPQAEDAARWLFFRISARDVLFNRFSRFYLGKSETAADFETMLQQIGKVRCCLGPGGAVDLDKTANLMINDFRRGAFGRISLEEPEAAEGAEGEEG
ncbi:MAG: ribosome biogenesis GTPase YlqF [Bacillota bacterium]